MAQSAHDNLGQVRQESQLIEIKMFIDGSADNFYYVISTLRKKIIRNHNEKSCYEVQS